MVSPFKRHLPNAVNTLPNHHGVGFIVGVIPTVLVSQTVVGIRAGRDEVLERAISLATGRVVP